MKALKMIYKVFATIALIVISYLALLGYMIYLFAKEEIALLVFIPITILAATIIMLAVNGQKSRGEKLALKILIGIGLFIELIFMIYFIWAIVRLY